MGKAHNNVQLLNALAQARYLVTSVVGDGSNETAAIQAAIDAAPDYSTLVFPLAPVEYSFTRLSITKSLSLDFSASQVRVNPSEGSLTLARGAAINFTGSRGSSYNFNPLALAGLNTLTLTTPAEAANFAAGDYVYIRDSMFNHAWDDPSSTGTGLSTTMTSTGSTGRSEPNIVVAVDTGTGVITLRKPMEFNYSVSANISKVTPLRYPAVRNIRKLIDTDPGGAFTGSVTVGPNLIAMAYSVGPLVENVHIDGIQLRGVQFNFSYSPALRRCSAKNPFRPSVGGHGYLMQFNNCTNGLAHHNRTEGIRHAIDFTMAFDCISRDNVSIDSVSTAFFCHGLMAKRCKSVDDTIYNQGNNSAGWGVGNASFREDYDFKVVRPTFVGQVGPAVSVFGFSENTEVIDPNFIFNKPVTNTAAARGVYVSCGAKNTLVRGGTIDFAECLGSASDAPISTSSTANFGDAYLVPPDGLRVEGTIIKTSRAAGTSGVGISGCTGDVVLSPRLVGGGTGVRGIRVTTLSALNRLVIEGAEFSGTFDRGIWVEAAPSVVYRVLGNRSYGTYAVAFKDLIASALLDQGDATLMGWALTQAFVLTNATRNVDGAITTASILWPDGTAGVFTADVLSSAFVGATDAWHATYLGSVTRTITQLAVTRNADGAVTLQPAITIV